MKVTIELGKKLAAQLNTVTHYFNIDEKPYLVGVVKEHLEMDVEHAAQMGDGRTFPPNPEQVTAYSRFIGHPFDGKAWCDYYASQGWMFQGVKMRNWHEALRVQKDKNMRLPQSGQIETGFRAFWGAVVGELTLPAQKELAAAVQKNFDKLKPMLPAAKRARAA
jgi:hypothetical protein